MRLSSATKREFIIVLLMEVKPARNTYDFPSVYRIKKRTCCLLATNFDGPVRDVNGRFFMNDEEQLKGFREQPYNIRRVAPLVDEMTSHRNKRIWASLSDKKGNHLGNQYARWA